MHYNTLPGIRTRLTCTPFYDLLPILTMFLWLVQGLHIAFSTYRLAGVVALEDMDAMIVIPWDLRLHPYI